MINDGLWCSFENWHMGNAGEVVATECGISRQAQDAYALESHRKAAEATDSGLLRRRDSAGLDSAEEGRCDHRRAR
jgi:acetyl-CoA acetyltransferase